MHFGLYGILVGALLLLKGSAAVTYLFHRRRRDARPVRVRDISSLNVAAVITLYNEDPAVFRSCLESFLRQDPLPHSLTVVDDGSDDMRALLVAHSMYPEFDRTSISYTVLVHTRNKGKREGLATGFRRHPEADLFMAVDSDTVLHDQAIAEALKGFADEDVTAVTGLVLARNRKRNTLTRLQNLRYANAFLFERGAYSLFGSVLCCCGSLALYDAGIVRLNLGDFLDQRFLGRKATFGDDRRLTNYCLQWGKVLVTPLAIAETNVPVATGHYLRQQVRWSKSFVRETIWVLRNFRARSAPWLLSALEAMVWVVFPAALLTSIGLAVSGFAPMALLWYVLAISVVSYLRSSLYLTRKVPGRLRHKLGTFALAPLYGVANLFVLIWVRLYAAATLRNVSWGTRRKVEAS